ncbi:MAG: aspartyl protease family protein [Candidatus Eisenbacteria bacterium]
MKEHVTRIPLEGTDHRGFYKCSYMSVKINGHGPFTFLFDTGASFTAFSSKVIQSAHVPVEVERGGYHDLVRVKEMKVGGVTIQNLVAVRDDDFGVDGVLGFRAFGDMNLTFELADRKLLVSPEPVPLPGGFEVPFETPHNIPLIPVTVDTTRVATLIDTGDDAYAWEARTEDLKGAVLAHPPSPSETVLNGANSSQTYVSTLESTVRLGPLAIEHAVVGINDALPVPDFGVDFLKDFNVEFDPKRMIVTFQPLLATSGTKIAGNLSTGFTLRFDAQGTVQNVVPGSTAEQRGMHTGDRILSIDGRPIAGFVPRTWDQALATGRPLSIRWLQGAKERTDDFEVTELR